MSYIWYEIGMARLSLNIHRYKAKVTSNNMYHVVQAENSILYQFEAAQYFKFNVIASHPGADADGTGLGFVDKECWYIMC